MAEKLSVCVCRVKTPEGLKDYVTLLPPEVFFSQGLAAEAIVGVLLRPLEKGQEITPENFARNRVFVEFLHAVIARYGADQTACRAEAKRLGQGWVYVIDQRTPTPQGPIPAEDILGGFEVKASEIVPGSYRPNPNHVILSSSSGFFQLDDELRECLLRELTARQAQG